MLLPALWVAAVMSATWAAEAPPKRVIELKDGGQVVLRTDGTMSHVDASGVPVAMPDGVVMTTKDGTRIMMKGASLWQEALELAATYYGRTYTLPSRGDKEGRRLIDLKGGGRIEMQADGTTVHYDAAGNRVRMADGDAMTAVDGTLILMNNGTLWKPAVNNDAIRSRP
jgi:ferric-dicitrate binding protein FerR (iron transport regulator)